MDSFGSPYSLTGSTGTMAAALGANSIANSIVFAIQAIANPATPNNVKRGPIVSSG